MPPFGLKQTNEARTMTKHTLTEADARLIASSPQLLAALREIARIARAAIARATDESQ